MLNHRLAGMQHMRVGHVMHEQQQIVRTRRERLIQARHRRRILTDKSRARCDRTIHADARFHPPDAIVPSHFFRRIQSPVHNATPMMSVSPPAPSGPVYSS